MEENQVGTAAPRKRELVICEQVLGVVIAEQSYYGTIIVLLEVYTHHSWSIKTAR